jgi:hypothetical protein
VAAVATTDPQPATPPATPAPNPEPTPITGDCSAVNAYDWNVRIAYAICMAESGGNPTKDNAGLNRDGSIDYGLMQVNSIHADMVGGDLESLRNPDVNMRVAYSLSHQGTDWTAWSAYNNGKYLSYL